MSNYNSSDWGTLMRHPIAVTIAAKCHGEHHHAALLQIATWHSAHWRSLIGGGNAPPPGIEFLVGLIVQAHDWQSVPSIRGKDGVARLFDPTLRIGDGRSEKGILKLIVSLQRLKKHAEETFWPAFKAGVLGIYPAAT